MTSQRTCDVPYLCWTDKHAAKMVVPTINKVCFDGIGWPRVLLHRHLYASHRRAKAASSRPAMAKGVSDQRKNPEKQKKFKQE